MLLCFLLMKLLKIVKIYFSSAHPLLVLQEHVLLEQHLLQPGRTHEPPCGLLLPSGRFPWRSVNFHFITPEVLKPHKPHCFIAFLKLHCFIEAHVPVEGASLLNSQFLLKKSNGGLWPTTNRTFYGCFPVIFPHKRQIDGVDEL